MPLETASYIDGLNPANPLSTDIVAQADDHLRLIKQTLKNTFPNINAPVTATAAQINNPVPTGLIAMWAGSILAVPTGWALCDGANGTPDLRNRFIVGAGSTYGVGAAGGSSTSSAAGGHTHTASTVGDHTHGGVTGSTTLTADQIPAHTHTWSGTSTSEDNNYTAGTNWLREGSTVNGSAFTVTTASSGGGQSHNHTISSDGSHTHTINAVSDHTHTLTPPYFALAYIMKL